MIRRVFTVYDNKAEMFMTPFFEITKGQAIRAFQDVTHNKDHAFNRHPDDYALFDLGTYDDNSGQFTNNKVPLLLLRTVNAVVEDGNPKPSRK